MAIPIASAEPGPPIAAWLAIDTVARSTRRSQPIPYATTTCTAMIAIMKVKIGAPASKTLPSSDAAPSAMKKM